MELRSREELSQQNARTQGTLNFRSTKKLLQLQQKGLPNHSKARRLFAQTKQEEQGTWPPAHDNKPIKKTLSKKLSPKLLLLEEFYHSLEAAVSLLRIRHEICTFSTIAAAVESSTHRRFLRSHLAQIKHILPEALQVEEYSSWDAESQCSRRDLRVTLLQITTEGAASTQRFMSPQKSTDMVVRRREFHRRLVEFFCNNKEMEVDVPQASLVGSGVAAACDGGCDTRLPDPFLGLEDDPQEVCTSQKEKVSQNDCDETLDAEECQHRESPIGFNVTQLKKYPRSPSKIHQQQAPPAPLHGSMSHLPPIFKPHFSMKRGSAAAEIKGSKAADEAVLFAGSLKVTPHFSLRKYKHAPLDKVGLVPLEQETSLADSDAVMSPIKTPVDVFSPISKKPCGRFLHFNCHTGKSKGHGISPQQDATRMPKPEKITRAHEKAMSSEPATPFAVSNAFLSPIKTPANGLSYVTENSCGNQSRVLSNANRALLFNSPVVKNKESPGCLTCNDGMHTPKWEKRTCTHDKERLGSTEQATPLAVTNASISPIQTPASELSSVARKPSGNVRRTLRNVSRVLPFNSPIGQKKRPGSSPHEDGRHMPKCAKLSELEPCNMVEDQSRVEDPGNICLEDGDCVGNFVDLTSTKDTGKLSASDVEILKCLPLELLNDVQAKEKKQLEDEQSGIELKRRRQQLIAGLPKLFNMVRLIFQSGNRTVLTSKDLTKMVLSSHPDITDQGEIMEQLRLLVELAPQWISLNLSSTGDSLYRINKNANMRDVSKALVEAK